MKSTDNIEEKIKKLLALSQSSNPNEARAALLKAQDLMLKHNLSINYESDKPEIITESVTMKHTKHHIRMAAIIAGNFRTKTWYGFDYISFIGYKDDVTASKSCLEYLISESATCFSKYMYEHEADFQTAYKSYANYVHRQWMNGFVSGIQDAFEERKNNPEYELMLITPSDVLKEYEKMNLQNSTLRASEIHNKEAFEAGYEEGKEALDRRSHPEDVGQ